MEVAEKKKALVPKLRFGEFEAEWKRNTIKELFQFFNGYAFSSKDASEKGVRWVKIADVGVNQIRNENKSFLPESHSKKHDKFLLKEGDYVVALTRPILSGKLKIARVGRDLEGALLNQRVGKIETEESIEFVYSFLQRSSLISKIENRIAGTDPPNLSPNEINSIMASFPSLPEQQKIASFLSAVDEKIQQLCKKKGLLDQYKKGVMQKLFPKKAGQAPELRFKKPDGTNYPDWEEKSFGEVNTVLDSLHQTPKEYVEKGYAMIRVTDVQNGKLILNNCFKVSQPVFEEFTKRHLPKKGEIIMSRVGSCGSSIQLADDAPVCLGQNTVLFMPKIENDYVFTIMKSRAFLNQVDRMVVGSTQKTLSLKDLKKFKTPTPSRDEQQKIADFLSSIDQKINQVETQIIQTKTFKKGVLQQMFV